MLRWFSEHTEKTSLTDNETIFILFSFSIINGFILNSKCGFAPIFSTVCARWYQMETGLKHMHTWLTSLFIQLVEYFQQLWVHVVDGLEEGEHRAVVGDAASTHVVALHAVKESGDGILQCLQELLMVLLGFSILILLLKKQTQDIQWRTWLKLKQNDYLF